MKKMYIICFLLLGTIASAAYLISYQYVYQKTHQEESYESKHEISAEDMTQPVNQGGEDIITKKTAYIVETYDLKGETLVREELSVPMDVMGYNRKLMETYLQSYMENMGLEEIEAGLVSFELKEFSAKQVVLRKTYRTPDPVYQYYLDVQLGRVVVCNAEDGSLYAYTQIKFQRLPETLQREILSGKYLESIAELYEFLEAYSS